MDEEINENVTTKEIVNRIWENSSSRLGFLTTFAETKHNVMTIEWISHIQFDPPMVAISLVKGYQSVQLLKQNPEFGLTFASKSQVPMINQLGSTSGANEDKFSNYKFNWRDGLKIKARVITDGVMALECKVRSSIEFEKSILFAADVLTAQFWDNEPLGYHQGKIRYFSDIIG